MNRLYKMIASILIISVLLVGAVYAAAPTDFKKLAEDKYKDVKAIDWFAEYVGKLTELNIVNGYNGAFDPKGFMTRAQFVKMLVVAMDYKRVDSVSFEDIKPFPTSEAHWAAVYVETALRNGIIIKEEVGDNFYPDTPLLRRDMAVMMCRALELEPSTGDNPFVDIVEPNGYITKLFEEYLLLGDFTNNIRTYRPEAISSRAEVTAIVSRMVDYKADPEGYKAKMAVEENYKDLVARIKVGNYTEEDLLEKSRIELEKQKADKTYIPEPILKVEHVNDETLHARITLLNYRDYNNDFMIKMHCTNYTDINTNRYNGLMGLKTIKVDEWKEAQRAGKTVLFDIPERNGKFVGKTCEYFSYNFESGTVFNFKMTYKRNNLEISFDYSVTIR